jgi:hypothetical protein
LGSGGTAPRILELGTRCKRDFENILQFIFQNDSLEISAPYAVVTAEAFFDEVRKKRVYLTSTD